MLVVPELISPEITGFAAALSGGNSPVVIPIVPASDTAYLSCWQNVQEVCKHRAGQPVKGWRIWWIPEILIEAQAHVVWRSPQGQLIDVTPNEDGERTCVFVGDPNMTAEPGNDFVPSRHENLCGEAFVDEYIHCVSVVSRHQDSVNTTGLWLPDPPELVTMRQALQQIEVLHQRLSGTAQ